jgi:RNA polymerase sigma-70 factor (ECF subfamily)
MKKETLEKLEDSDLIALSVKNVPGAFDALYGRYRLPLFSYLNNLLRGRNGVVDDLFQQTWIKAVRNLDKYRERQRFFAWLCSIAHNLTMDFYRSPKNADTVEIADDLAVESTTPQAVMEYETLHQRLQEAILLLPPEQQAVVKMRNQGISFKEIAESQRITINTALGRMHYAVLRLRKLLEE